MGVIHQLPEDIAIKIAAGEVVERPASVVKELLENSLDAGATKIEISLEDGGRTKIEIKDNGSGMDPDDAQKAFLRHGTSKIKSVDDLLQIATLGFRGEALAAIGASAEVELITTQTNAATGTRVVMEYGAITQAKPHAPLLGTHITVSNLFAALPARQKFLKSDATEWKASLDILIKQILTHPEVAFVVRHNNKVIHDLSAGSFSSRVAQLWKVSETDLISLDIDHLHMKLTGVVGKPEIAHEGKGRQFLSVNNHPVNDKMIVRGVKDAFGTLLPPGLYPSFALNLQVHPGMVDVNIHPRKEEVRFVNPQEVYRFVRQAISQEVASQNVAFSRFEPAVTAAEVTPTFAPTPRPAAVPAPSFSFGSPSSRPAAFAPARYPARNATFTPVPVATELPAQSSDPILTLDRCYLVTLHDDKLLLIDQHAAHERILYNQLWERDGAQALTVQPLLLPEPLELNVSDQALFEMHRHDLESLGFTFESDALTGVPQLGKVTDPKTFFVSLLRSLDEERSEPELTSIKHKRFAMMACKAAVKAGDIISEGEKQKLIQDLLSLSGGFTCPHGRPSHIEIAPSELEKLFKRTGF